VDVDGSTPRRQPTPEEPVTTARLSLLFRVDAAANAALALAAVALLAAPDLLGLPRWALVLIAVLAAANALDLARSGRRTPMEPTAVRRAVAVDVAFGVTMVAVAAIGLSGQSDAARWVLAAVGDVSLVVGALKLAGVRAVRHATA
jgi:hypothetical protein